MDFETTRKLYIKRNNCTDLSEDDTRLIQAIYNLHKNYSKELENRKSTILINHEEAFVAPIIKKDTKQKQVQEIQQHICQATKMDGNKCTAKAKPGCVFCGRHLPKLK